MVEVVRQDMSVGGRVAIVQPRAYNTHLVKASVIAADLVSITIAMVASFSLSRMFRGADGLALHSGRHLLVGGVSLAVWAMVFSRYRLYSARCVSNRFDEFGRLLHAVLTSVLAMAFVSFMLKMPVARSWLILTFAVSLLVLAVERELVRTAFSVLRKRGHFLRPIVVVGANAEAVKLCQLLLREKWLGYRVVGVVDDTTAVGTAVVGAPVLGPVSETLELVRQMGASGVLVAISSIGTDTCNRLTRKLVEAGIHLELSSSLCDVASERLTVRPLSSHPVIYVEPVHRDGWRMAAKRAFDLVVASIALLLLSPLLALVAVAIKISAGGPVLFRQERVGRSAKPFKVLKFRTMVTEAEDLIADLLSRNEADGPLFKMRKDPRVTPVGEILRRLSIDELPQLWNVIRGEMSLVGPRPALFSEMAAWPPELPELKSRLQVRPGMTGMWQVSGRSNSSFADYLRYDLYYVDNWSLWRDLAIVAKTIPVVLSRRGAS